MFFVEKIKSKRRVDFTLIHWGPTLIIFLAFLGVTYLSWLTAKDRADQDLKSNVNQNLKATADTIQSRINAHEVILRAEAGLFKSSDEVSRQEWNQFAKAIDFENLYPGVEAIGFSSVIPAGQLDAHEAEIRGRGVLDYDVKPGGARAVYTSLLYSESREDSDSIPDTIGYDLYTEPIRKVAIDSALTTGKPTLTGKILPISSPDPNLASIAMYLPIFSGNQTTGQLADAQGIVQLSVRLDPLFKSVLGGQDQQNFGYRVYASDLSEANKLFESPSFAFIQNQAGKVTQNQQISFNQKTWTVEVSGGASAGTPQLQEQPTNILVAGVLVSFLMSILVYILLVSRTRSVALAEEREVADAKDELLALASHQLRTPATGVKQYIGMLREGYVGTLSKDQHKTLDKAYASNEQQLHIITDMLSVARADTGRLPIHPKRTNLNQLIREIVDQQQQSFISHNQKLRVALPKDPIHAHIDPHYLRMSISNLLDNASKYTPDRGAIDLSLKKSAKQIIIRINDTGVGIPERHFPLLFRKFSSIPNELASQAGGTGIGLYLAKHIVEMHGGHLTFSSEAGVGSSFTVTLPAHKVTKNQVK